MSSSITFLVPFGGILKGKKDTVKQECILSQWVLTRNFIGSGQASAPPLLDRNK